VRRATGIERSTLSSHYEESDPEGDSHSFEEFNSVSTASDSSVLEDGYINDSFRLDFTPDSTTLSTSSSGELISDSSGGGNDTVDATSISIDNTYGEKGAFERSSTIEYNEETPYQTNGTDVTRWTDNFAYTVTEISVDDVTGDDTDTSGSTGSGGSTGGDDGVGGFGGGGFGGGPGSDSGGDDSPGSDVYVYEDEEFRHEFSGSSVYTHDSEFFLTHINPTLSYSYENNSSATSADGSSSSASSGTFEGKPAHTDVEAFSSFEANSSYSEDGLYTDANQVDTLRLVFKEEISNTAALIDSSNSSAGTYSDSYQATTGVGEFSTEEVDTTIITSVLTVHGRTTTWEDWAGSETDDTDEGSDDDGAGDDGTGDDGTGDDTGDSSDDSDEDTRPEKGDLLVTLATTVTSIGSDNAQFTETTDFGSSGDGGTDSGDSNFSTNSGGEWDVTSFERIEYFEGGYVDIYNSIDGDSSGNSNVNTDGRFEGDYTGTSFDGSDYDTEVDSDYSSSGTTESESTIGGSTTLEYYEDQVLSASGTITQDTTTSGESEASFERRNEKTGQTNGQDWDTLGHSGDDFTDEFNSNEVTTWTSSLDAEGNYQLDEDVVRNNTFSGEHSQWDVGDDVIDDDSGNLGGSSGGGDVGAGSSDGTTGDGDNEGTVVGSYAYTNNDEGGGFAGDGYGSFGFAAQYRNTNGADNFAFTSFGEPIGGSGGTQDDDGGGAGGVGTDDDDDTTGGSDGDETTGGDGEGETGGGDESGDGDGTNTGNESTPKPQGPPMPPTRLERFNVFEEILREVENSVDSVKELTAPYLRDNNVISEQAKETAQFGVDAIEGFAEYYANVGIKAMLVMPGNKLLTVDREVDDDPLDVVLAPDIETDLGAGWFFDDDPDVRRTKKLVGGILIDMLIPAPPVGSVGKILTRASRGAIYGYKLSRGVAKIAKKGSGIRRFTVSKIAPKRVPFITPGSLPAKESAALRSTMSHLDAGTKPTGALKKKWGTKFKNYNGDLPGKSGVGSPFREYRVAPGLGEAGAGTRRVVVNSETGEVFYTWTHYGDTGNPPFVRIR
jgi:hypothetical protein